MNNAKEGANYHGVQGITYRLLYAGVRRQERAKKVHGTPEKGAAKQRF